MEKKMITGLNDICKQHHYNMREKGFWETEDMICELGDAGKIDSDEELKVHNELLTARIGLVISELGEAMDALRENKHGYNMKDTFEDELADTFLRLMDIVGGLDIDIERQLLWKSEFNKNRGLKHGKLF
jgi:NTP pyrophosphatase (non-canonical NTP hydrolase)